MVLGGGGSPSPIAELLVQLAFVAALLAWIWMSRANEPVSLPLFWFGLMLLGLPILQLIPLPPEVWRSLPGRELQAATLALIGEDHSWRPLSISPPLTFAGLLAIAPAVGTMWAVSTLHRGDRRFLLAAVAVVTLAGAALGALQIASGPEAFRLYEKSHRGWLTAFHANRNAAADVLLIGSMALTTFYMATRNLMRRLAALVLSAQAVLLIALLLTGSRAGIALLLVTLVFHWQIVKQGGVSAGAKRLWAAVMAVLAGLIALPLLFVGNTQLARVAGRFDVTGDARIPLWEDTLAAIDAFGWAGSGIGTFTNAFMPYESLAYLDAASPNRAHNDYLELLLEAGVLAPILLVGGAVLIVVAAQSAWRLSPRDHAIHLFASGGLAVIALHSIVDYPLRNMAIACLAGALAGLLSPSTDGSRGRDKQDGAL